MFKRNLFFVLSLILIVISLSSRYSEAQDDRAKYNNVSELDGKPIGVQTGVAEWADLAKETFPNSEIVYFNTFADMAAALDSRKIEGFLLDEPVFALMASTNNRIAMLADKIDEALDVAYVFAKTERGNKLCDELGEYIRSLRSTGELEKIITKWTGPDEETKTLPDYKNFPAPNGILSLATEGEYPPFNYYRGTEIAGLEIDIAAKFCEAYGYGLEVTAMSFNAILPAIASGKFDFGASGIAVIEEGSENVKLSEPYYACRTVVACLKASPSVSSSSSFWEELKASFNRTFFREDRYKLFIEGIINTMIITVLSIIFGTILGFIVFMLCRKGNIIANSVTNFSIWLIQGTPLVVLLMILYYVIFGHIDIKAIWVSIIAFTLTFGSSFYGMLQFGAGAVDIGQTEAAYALGFTDWQTFFKIILPQAALHFMPSYKAEVSELVKATAIVGYIAVQDLTKMGDIVRSRTYEAFFPLISVAVIYFILAALLNTITNIIHARITPSKRKPEDILRGIKMNIEANGEYGEENHD